MKITIGIPAFNEAKNIAAIIVELKKRTDSIVVCDDGSSDLTSEISEKLGVIVIRHEKNMGYGAAINSIFKKFCDFFTLAINPLVMLHLATRGGGIQVLQEIVPV